MKRFCFLFLFAVSVFAQSSKDEIRFNKGDGTLGTSSSAFLLSQNSDTTVQSLVIQNGSQMLVAIGMDGKITYGSNYKPDEAAKIFWETIGSYAPQAPTPKPEWVPDPAAGHYDCPDGWTAFARSEPEKPWNGPVATSAIYIEPHKDKKGHVLGEQPPAPICIRDAK